MTNNNEQFCTMNNDNKIDEESELENVNKNIIME